MASLIGPQSLHRGRFICKACLSRSRRPGTHRIVPRFRQNASFSNRASATPLTQTHSIRSVQSVAPQLSAQVIDILPSRRLYSTETPPSEPASSGLAPLPSRRLISLSGPDTAKFLQGLITNNVDLERRSPFYAAFLDARGRVLWDVFVWVYPELVAKEGGWACYIEVDGGEVEAMVKHFTRHKLRSNIKIAVVEENEMSVWAAWGVQPEQLPSEQLIASIPDPRGFASTDFGTRCLFTGNQAPAYASAPVVDTRQYHLRRYLAGIPEGPQEIQRENALPMECNIDLSQGIDFRKGCYVGQELTIRTKHTGVVRKRILPVRLYTSDPPSDSSNDIDPNWPSERTPEIGADIKQLDENGSIKKGRAAGKFIGAIGNIGLALCRLEIMTSMRVSAEGGSWKPGVEFGVQKEGGEVVKVQAVVSQGFRKRERDVWDKARTRI